MFEADKYDLPAGLPIYPRRYSVLHYSRQREYVFFQLFNVPDIPAGLNSAFDLHDPEVASTRVKLYVRVGRW